MLAVPTHATSPVHAQRFRVQEAVVVHVAFRSRRHHIPDIGVGRPVDKRVIRLARHHDPHIDPRTAGDLQRIQDRIIRDEIRRLDIHMVFRTVDQPQIIVVDRLGL